jgi:LAO/AO transport system kinase
VKFAQSAYKQALALFPPKENKWPTSVLACSALTGQGISSIWEMIVKFETITAFNKSFAERRKAQNVYWLREQVTTMVFKNFNEHPKVKKQLPALERMVANGKISVTKAANELFEIFLRK